MDAGRDQEERRRSRKRLLLLESLDLEKEETRFGQTGAGAPLKGGGWGGSAGGAMRNDQDGEGLRLPVQAIKKDEAEALRQDNGGFTPG